MYATLKARSSSPPIAQKILFTTRSTRKLARSAYKDYDVASKFKLNDNDMSASMKLFKRSVQTTAKKDTLNYILQDKTNQRHKKIKEELSKQTVKSLKNQLRSFNLKVSGNKPELVERLTNYSLNETGVPAIKTVASHQAKLYAETVKSLSNPTNLDKTNDGVKKVVKSKSTVSKRSLKANSKLFLSKQEIGKENKSVDKTVQSFVIKAPSKPKEKLEPKTEILVSPKKTAPVEIKSFSSIALPVKGKSKSILAKTIAPVYEDIRFEDLPNYTISNKEKVVLLSAVLLSFIWITFGINAL